MVVDLVWDCAVANLVVAFAVAVLSVAVAAVAAVVLKDCF